MKKKKNTIHIDRDERRLVLDAMEFYAEVQANLTFPSEEEREQARKFIDEMERLIHGKG